MTNTSILISIITVTYNAGDFIEKTIENVALQTYPNIEYIIVDGGSTDHTVEIIKKHTNVVTRWISEPDKGIYDAMNKGIKMSTGELIGIVNASDYYEPNAIEVMANAYQNHKDCGIFHGNINLLNEDGSFFKLKKPDTDLTHLSNGFTLYHPTFFVTRATYEQRGLYDTQFKITADYDFALRCSLACVKFYYVDKVISNFCIGGISSTDRAKCLEESRQVLINNGIQVATADETYQKWLKNERKNMFYRTVYDFMRRFLPNKLMSRIALKFSVK